MRIAPIAGLIITSVLLVAPSVPASFVPGSCSSGSVTLESYDTPVAVNTGGHHAAFTVKNTSTDSATVTTSCSATKTLTCTFVSPDTFLLAPGGSRLVTVTFAAGGTAVAAAVNLFACSTSGQAWPISAQ